MEKQSNYTESTQQYPLFWKWRKICRTVQKSAIEETPYSFGDVGKSGVRIITQANCLQPMILYASITHERVWLTPHLVPHILTFKLITWPWIFKKIDFLHSTHCLGQAASQLVQFLCACVSIWQIIAHN